MKADKGGGMVIVDTDEMYIEEITGILNDGRFYSKVNDEMVKNALSSIASTNQLKE